jgi:hypothetical protein
MRVKSLPALLYPLHGDKGTPGRRARADGRHVTRANVVRSRTRRHSLA